jgi:hypothetical protein
MPACSVWSKSFSRRRSWAGIEKFRAFWRRNGRISQPEIDRDLRDDKVPIGGIISSIAIEDDRFCPGA